MTAQAIDYTSVTEMTGYNVTAEQIQRMYTRYMFAAEYCNGKDVLEIACGSGQGLGLLASAAKSVTGGDVDPKVLAAAKNHFGQRVTLSEMDAQALPLPDQSLDVVILYEAIYYIPNAALFFKEAKRVLRPGGTLIIGSANKEWEGFNPSPYSHVYFTASDLKKNLDAEGFSTTLFADCNVEKDGGLKSVAIDMLKKTAVKLNLIPKTMKGKELLKRLFHGRLQPLPAELKQGQASAIKPVPITDGPVPFFKVIFAVATLPQ